MRLISFIISVLNSFLLVLIEPDGEVNSPRMLANKDVVTLQGEAIYAN